MNLIEQAAKRFEALAQAAEAAAPAGATTTESTIGAVDWQRVDALRGEYALSRRDDKAGSSTAPRVARPLRPHREVTLDLRQLELAGCMVPSDTRSPLAEQLRAVKRPLLKNARSKQAVSERLAMIMVTSALPGEGKTYTSVNLAMSIAMEIDVSVLLVDADVERRGAMARLGVQSDTGLIDLLADETLKLEDLAMGTNVPKLSLLPGGRRSHLSTELLASAAMDMLLQRFATEFPGLVVIFDAPPLLLTSEAKVLASRVGQVVMVVEAERTPRTAVTHAFAALEQCPIVMSILNKTRLDSPDENYGYGYGYY